MTIRSSTADFAAARDFNDRHPIGTPVRYWKGFREGDGKVSRTRTVAQMLSGHTPVVWVEGEGACIGLTHVQPISEEELSTAPAEQQPGAAAEPSTELDRLRVQVAALTAELEKVRAQLTAANHHADGLAADVCSLQQANTAYANENARLRSKLADQQPVVNAAQDWRELRKSCPKTPNADALLRGAVDRLQSSRAGVA